MTLELFKKYSTVKPPDNSKYLRKCNEKRETLKEEFRSLRLIGLTLEQIAKLYNIQKQRVWQVLRDYRPWRKNENIPA